MKSFEYLVPESIEEACSLLSRYSPEAKVIAGGQSLLVLLRQKLLSPSYLVSIKELTDLDYMRCEEDGLRIGAVTTHRTIELSPIIRNKFPVLAEAERRLASVQVRNWGTIGGNLCHGDPKTDLAACLIALGSKVKLTSEKGEREVDLEEFFTDYYETCLNPDEIMTSIEVPYLGSRTGAYYEKFSLRWADAPIVGVCGVVALDAQRNMCNKARVVIAGAGPTPVRAREAEEMLQGEAYHKDLLGQAALLASQHCSPTSDAEASEEYKRELVRVLAQKVLKVAWERAAQSGESVRNTKGEA